MVIVEFSTGDNNAGNATVEAVATLLIAWKHTMQLSRRDALWGITSLLATATLPVAAGGFPDKPVKITVGFAASGAADIVARQLRAKLTEQTGQAFIVDNKPGATGTVAATALCALTSRRLFADALLAVNDGGGACYLP